MESIKAQQASSIESLRSDIRNAIVVENIKIDSKLDRLTDRLERTEVQVVGVINQVKALASRPASGSPSLPALKIVPKIPLHNEEDYKDLIDFK